MDSCHTDLNGRGRDLDALQTAAAAYSYDCRASHSRPPSSHNVCRIVPNVGAVTVHLQTAKFVTISFSVAARSSSHSAKRIVTGMRTPDMSVGNSVGRVRAIQ
eukprot:4069990-Pleurochrysis_carterae.AAC.1